MTEHEKQRQKYISKSGFCCPWCGSARIDSESPKAEDDGSVSAEVKCLDCQRIWIDIFILIDFQETPDE